MTDDNGSFEYLLSSYNTWLLQMKGGDSHLSPLLNEEIMFEIESNPVAHVTTESVGESRKRCKQVGGTIAMNGDICNETTKRFKKMCKKSCCNGEKIPRGQPVKSANECNPNDIGLHFKTACHLSDTEKYELIKNIWKPPLNYNFPQHVESGRHWRFNRDYIDERSDKFYPWLAYSAYYDGAFCISCVLFGHNFGHTKVTRLFKEPFTRWNGASTRWETHDTESAIHQSSIVSCRIFIKKIVDIADSVTRKRIAENRKKLIPILKTIVFCGKQNIPLRGDRDNSEDQLDKSRNYRNFQALLNFRIDAGDEVLKHHFNTALKNATYQPSMILNEIIATCKKYIQGKLLNEIKGKYFAIMANNASDFSNIEQLSLILRFVDDRGEIQEVFMEFIQCPSLKGDCIAKLILDVIQNKYHLNMNLCVGQCYDGASNMAGIGSSVASIITAKYPNALYFHCASHRLNLVVVNNCLIESVRNMIDSVNKTSDIFQCSAKKQLLLANCIKEEIPEESRKKLLHVCCTQWILCLDGMVQFQEMLKPIITTLELLSKNWDGNYNTDGRAVAGGLVHHICTFDFIINLVIVRHTLAYIQPLTYELQQVKIDIAAYYEAIDNNLKTLKKVRGNVNERHREWFDHATSLCNKLNIAITKPCTVNIQRNGENYESDNTDEYYRRSLTIPFLDGVISELEGRFSPSHRIHGNAFYAIPSYVVTDKRWREQIVGRPYNNGNGDVKKEEELFYFTKKYQKLLPNFLSLPAEMDLWETFWSNILEKVGKVPDNIPDSLKSVVSKKNWFPNLFSILEIVGAIPSLSNSCQQSISKSRSMKRFLHSTMEQQHLNGLALLYAHHEIEVDYKELSDIFARDYPHRLKLINILDKDSL